MDLLRAELKRKKAALAKAKQNEIDNDNYDHDDHDDGGSHSSSDNDNKHKKKHKKHKKQKKRRKYLKAKDLRRVEEEEEEERQRQQKRRRFHQQHDQEQDQQGSLSSSTTTTSKAVDVTKQQKTQTISSTNDIGNTTTTTTTREDSGAGDPSTTTDTNTTTNDVGVDHSLVQDTTPLSISTQLRQLGLVVRYYGEHHTERLSRLQTALLQRQSQLKGLSELEEFRLGRHDGHNIQNTFLQKDDNNDMNINAAVLGINNSSSKKKKKSKTGSGAGENSAAATSSSKSDSTKDLDNAKRNDNNDDDDDDEQDDDQIIYKFLKELLKEWEQDLANRPESVARSVTGRNESKTFKQCKDYIRPLFRLLKRRSLEAGLQHHLLKIVNYAKDGEFVKAHDEYMNVAIGRAAWPIGVTMVGIHARSGRAKIESSNVAHVMNSELQRKYLTSVKRLLTYAQNKRSDVAPSKKVQN